MPVYNVQAPDGTEFRVEAPEGATEDQVLAYAKQHWEQQQPSPKQSLAELKAQSPAYAAMSDDEFANRIYRKFYADRMTYPEFAQRAGVRTNQASGWQPSKVELMDEAARRGILPPEKAALLAEARSRGLVPPASHQPEQKPSRLQQIEQAFRKAHAAGNTEDARTLAKAYREERDRSAAPRYSEDELFQKLQRADAAGDTEAARVIADEIRKVRGEPRRANFENVSGSAVTVAGSPAMPSAQANHRGGGYVDQRLAELGAMGNGLRMSVAGTALGVGQMLGVAKPEHEEAYRRNRDRFAQQGGTWYDRGQFVGDAMQSVVPLSRVGAAGRAANYAGAAAVGGAYGASRPVVDQGDSRMANTVSYGAAGGLGQGIAHGLSAAGRKAPEAIRDLYEAARARGINLTPAQLSDSNALKFFQSQVGRLPFSGATARAGKERQAWNRALAREIGEDADAVTPEVYARAKRRHSVQFEDLASRNSLRVTDDLLQKLEDIKGEAAMLGDDAAKATANAVDALYKRVQAGDVVPGRIYQALDSQLGRAAKLGNEASHYVGRVRDAIREAMDGSISSGDQAAWRELRRQYGNRKTIRDLVAKEAGEDIAPRALMGRVNATGAGKERMATGTRGELGTLARVGQRMTEPPTSGTAERLMMLGTGAGAVANTPMTLAALLGGRAARQSLDSGFLARLLMSPNRGQYLQPAARIGRPSPTAGLLMAEDQGDRSW